MHTLPIKRPLYQNCYEYGQQYMRQQRYRVLYTEKQEKCLVVEVLPIHAQATLMCHKMIEKREAWFDLICQRIERERVGWWEKFHNKKVNSQRMTKRAHFS